MRFVTIFKAVAASAVVLMAVLLTGHSVPEPLAETSREEPTGAILEDLQPAPGKKTGGVIVKAATKRKRAQIPFLTASVTKIPDQGLLAVVQQKDIKAHHQELADKVLRSLPSPCRTYLQNFYVKYKDVTQRGLGGKTTIIIDGTAPDPEFIALLIHECGHVTHANMQGSEASGVSAFRDGQELFYNDSPAAEFFAISWAAENIRKAGSTNKDFASGYAESDAFEDFAETFAMYVLHRPAMRERAAENKAIAAKLAWMETYLPMPENALSTSTYTWNKDVPWDVTRLPHELVGSL